MEAGYGLPDEGSDVAEKLTHYGVPRKDVEGLKSGFCDCLRGKKTLLALRSVYGKVEEFKRAVDNDGLVREVGRRAVSWLLESSRWERGCNGGYKQLDDLYNVLGTVAAVSRKDARRGRELARETRGLMEECGGLFPDYLDSVQVEYGLSDGDFHGYVSPVFVGGRDAQVKFRYG